MGLGLQQRKLVQNMLPVLDLWHRSPLVVSSFRPTPHESRVFQSLNPRIPFDVQHASVTTLI